MLAHILPCNIEAALIALAAGAVGVPLRYFWWRLRGIFQRKRASA